VRDFLKVYSYANLYAAITPGVDLSDVTLTFVESRYPRKLLRYLTSIRGYTVEESSPGIYRVTGDYLPIQIIESRKLSEDENLWLNSMRDDLKRSSVRAMVKEGKKRGRKINIDAYMDVVLRANPGVFAEVQTMAKMGLPFETVVSATQLDPQKVRVLYKPPQIPARR
jgi:hypothetical protein